METFLEKYRCWLGIIHFWISTCEEKWEKGQKSGTSTCTKELKYLASIFQTHFGPNSKQKVPLALLNSIYDVDLQPIFLEVCVAL